MNTGHRVCSSYCFHWFSHRHKMRSVSRIERIDRLKIYSSRNIYYRLPSDLCALCVKRNTTIVDKKQGMDEEIEKKFAELQKYLPLVEVVIERLQNIKDKDIREIQLQKIQGLHRILLNKQIKLTIEELQQCEDFLQKLHNKVKENKLGLQLLTKQNGTTPQSSTLSENAKSNQYKKTAGQPQDAEKDIKIEETPASLDTDPSS